ncbi:hypothetical protein TrRE_jg12542 [Triparma retinervis]|uniref:Uncharacterized protein n=1 Tax=Triparma retinervis TaxID=2557542 RepID=A0A9W6ZWC4_9STRA|nr:hypothetical protein TrRE_jg12542 [Triparma retinervis]
MGGISSSPVEATFEDFKSWNLSAAKDMLLQYKSRDFDFGIDAQVVTSLIGGDTSLARSIMQAFGPSSTVINALSFMSAVVLLSKDLESASPMKSKCDLIFDIFDFHESGDMSLDEVTILLLSVLKGVNVVCGTADEPSDETMEQFTLVMFQSVEKPITGFLSRSDFTDWIMDWVGAEENADFATLLSRFTPGALITPEQQAAFELQAKLDAEKAEEEAKQRRELELKRRLEIEEAARKEAEEKVRIQREKEAAERRAEEERLEAERKVEEARLEAERKAEEEKRLEEEKKLEVERLVKERAEAEKKRAEEELLARERAEQDAAALKMQQLQRAKTAKAKVAAKRAELKKLEEEEKAAVDDSEQKGAEDTLTATLLGDIADNEETNVAATKLQAVQRRKEAKKMVEEKRKELAAAISEAGKEGAEEGLVEILNEAAAEEKEGGRGDGGGGGGGGKVKVEESETKEVLDTAAGEGGEGEMTEEEKELEKIKAAQAGRSRAHTIAHRTAAPLAEESIPVAEMTEEEKELEKIKAAQAGRSRAHTVAHRSAAPLAETSEEKTEEKTGEKTEEKPEAPAAEDDEDDALMAELEKEAIEETKDVEESKEPEEKKEEAEPAEVAAAAS